MHHGWRALLVSAATMLAACPGASPSETNCSDGLDDDSDGAIDCADDACDAAPECVTFPERCTGGGDEDGDGAIDCADSDCAGLPACAGSEACDLAGDEDGDGNADCDDADCASHPTCAVASLGHLYLAAMSSLDSDGFLPSTPSPTRSRSSPAARQAC